jgi:hypothetical protein
MALIALSDGERKYILEGVTADVRLDGRSRLDYRYVAVECGLLPQANGSARVTLVNGNTEVLAAVKVELVEPEPDAPAAGSIEFSVECWTSASPHFQGRGATDINAELTAALTRCGGGARGGPLCACAATEQRRRDGRLWRTAPASAEQTVVAVSPVFFASSSAARGAAYPSTCSQA